MAATTSDGGPATARRSHRAAATEAQ
ncbi:hypothetical protein VTP21DRAFT_9700, partial [Calcarisporiella thermophila]